MTRTSQTPAPATAPEPKAPDFIAWHVSNRGEKAFWTKVGAAWFHRDRKGLSLQLEVVPINGRIVLRTPLDDEATEGQFLVRSTIRKTPLNACHSAAPIA